MEERSLRGMSLGGDVGWWAPGAVTVRKEKPGLRECGVTPSLRDGSVHLEPPNSLCSKHFFSWESVCERMCIWYFLTGVRDRKPGSTPSQGNQQVCPLWQACRVKTSSVYSLCLSFCFFISFPLTVCMGSRPRKTVHESILPWRADVMCSIYISPPLRTLDEPLNNSYSSFFLSVLY